MSYEDARKKIQKAIEENATKLDLLGMRLEKLPSELGQLTQLTYLRLSNNQLSTLPPELGQLTNLQNLDLRNNQLSVLPPELGKLTKLKKLILGDPIGGGNQLSALPPELGQLTNLKTLNLYRNQLSALPPELGLLTNLQNLDLRNNQLSALLPKLGLLTNLQNLDLRNNQLSALPPELGQLTNLQTLRLDSNQLSALPSELGQLTNLQNLDLRNNQLSTLPPELGQLTQLKELHLYNNQLSALPPELGQLTQLKELVLYRNKLSALPPELGQLTQLKELVLYRNKLSALPPELGQLTALQNLDLQNNQLSALPPELGQLTALQNLDLQNNQLSALPPELGQLTQLKELVLYGNKLSALPPELGQLTALQTLSLGNNQLSALPPVLSQLTALQNLYLQNNQLSALPPELGQLTQLKELVLSDNPLTSPPPEIVKQGVKAVLAFLREMEEAKEEQWISKMLLVGEGGVGKTSLVKVLKGEKFDPKEDKTHGILQETLELPHPEKNDITMELKTWDFGGQQIYHATHQFFLTERSLYILVWNARVGYEQSKLEYWLDNIHSRAPKSPILLVATHIDQHPADFPLTDLKYKYPQIVGSWEVSNLEKTGIEELRNAIAYAAAKLPLMGETWPATWLNAMDAVDAHADDYISPNEFNKILLDNEVEENDIPFLAELLHDLGVILYFQKDNRLKETVVLNPEWMTKNIFKVLDCEDIGDDGIFKREHADAVWNEIGSWLQNQFLYFMEKFDLSYRIPDLYPFVSIIVERLSYEPKTDYLKLWNTKKDAKQISMKFKLDTNIPPGIPTWFIARSHRFTTCNHWRLGALFADDEKHTHLGLVQAFPHDRCLTLIVRGPYPQNFFTLLKDGLDLTLDRFPGIDVKRTIPCPGHHGKPCTHEFIYEQLLKQVEKKPEEELIRCPESIEDLKIHDLLFGLNPIKLIDDGELIEEENKDKWNEQTQREFLKQSNDEQKKPETACPRVFTLIPSAPVKIDSKFSGERIKLQLYCEMPGLWHPAGDSGCYTFGNKPSFFHNLSLFLRKQGIPLNKILPGSLTGSFENMNEELGFSKDLLEITNEDIGPIEIKESDVNILYKILDKLDKQHIWGGLKKILTPEGHYLWLCEDHTKEYNHPHPKKS